MAKQPPAAASFGTSKVAAYPKTVERLIAEFASLPGIGRRSAERLAFHILKSDRPVAERLSKALTDVKDSIRHCDVCWKSFRRGQEQRRSYCRNVCASGASGRLRSLAQGDHFG